MGERRKQKYSVIIQTNDLESYIREDWSGFKKSRDLDFIFEKLSEEIGIIFNEIAIENVEETKKIVKQNYNKDYASLTPLAKYEFNEALDHITKTNPTAKQESINLAMETLINLENTEWF
ncbi:hypothetical protein [Chryseobacterium sp. Marseille-Q8038]